MSLNNNRKKRLLIFSGDPGGAACVVPVIKALPVGYETTVLSKASAVQAFRTHNVDTIDINGFSVERLESIISGFKIDGVLTSASSLPEKDMTDRWIWQWARRNNIPSIAVLDQWDNYVPRFSGAHGRDRLAFLPDKICVMDELAQTEMVREGFPKDALCVTGQPALEIFEGKMSDIRAEVPKKYCERKPGALRLTFFSQPIFNFYGSSLGYDECSVLNDIMSVSSDMAREHGLEVTLVCKLHPKNSVDDFSKANRSAGIKLVFVKDELLNEDLIAASDIVLGMNSVMMIHSILAGIPTICYEPGIKTRESDFMPVRIKAIPRVTDRNGLADLIRMLRSDREYLQHYLSGQKACRSHSGAVMNITRLVCQTLDGLTLNPKMEN